MRLVLSARLCENFEPPENRGFKKTINQVEIVEYGVSSKLFFESSDY